MRPAPRYAPAYAARSSPDTSDRFSTGGARLRREAPFWVHLLVATVCASLVPVVTAVAASMEGANALARVAVAVVIALLAGSAISAFASARSAAEKRR